MSLFSLTQARRHTSSITTVSRTVTRFSSTAAVALSAFVMFGAAQARAPYLTTHKPITDDQGRIQVIVDFKVDAHLSFAGFTPREVPVTLKSGTFFHQPQVKNLISSVEQKYKFSSRSMTSWVGSSVTAYLHDEQIESLLDDRLVQQISQDSYSDLSAAQPWYDFNSGVESYSWGRMAVNGKVASSSSTRKIYVIDSGVAYHTDLPSTQVTRTNVACDPSGGCENQIPAYWTTTPYPVVGCYGHATHVAGILGAPFGNYGGSGVYAGAQMISLNVTTVQNGALSAELCTAASTLTQTAVGNALDYVMQQTLYDTQMSIVNISINSAGVGITSSGIPEPNWSKLRNLAAPVYRHDLGRQYYGAFVAQSAGNGARPVNGVYPTTGSDVCLWNSIGQPAAYKPYSSVPYSIDDDGIMVVGAISISANAADPFTPANPAVAATDPPSNYGRCVDIWAPGDAIWSTWGANPHNNYSNQTYSTMVRLSGTSMAAPHVAAAAAYVADVEGLTTPAAVEQRLRQLSMQFAGTMDASGQIIKVLQLP